MEHDRATVRVVEHSDGLVTVECRGLSHGPMRIHSQHSAAESLARIRVALAELAAVDDVCACSRCAK